MTLTAEQMRAAAAGENVRLLIDGIEYVILRSELFERLTASVAAEHEELRRLLAKSFEANGWNEPGMEAYDSYPAGTP